MNAVTVIERADVPAFSDWVEQGRGLIQRRREADWALADWWNDGRKHHRDEPQFKLFADALAADPKRLTEMAKVAEAFPCHMRAANVSFEVHREIAALPAIDRLEMIARASTEKWTERKAHAQVVERKYEQGSLLPEDDPEYRSAVEIIRAWNRATPESRQYFMELATPAKLGVIVETANA